MKVVIIGGGPAGAACGITLTRAGIPNCIVDRAVFPRDKLCGGLLTAKTQRLLHSLCGGDDAVWRGAVREEITSAALCADGRTLCEEKFDTPCLIAERRALDHALVRYYQSIGGTLYEGDGVRTIDLAAGRVITESGREFTGDYIIAADGANSLLRRLCGTPKLRPAPCVEIVVPAGEVPGLKHGCIGLYIGAAAQGYGWVFPRGDQAVLGIGGTGREMNRSFAAFLDSVGFRREDLRSGGACIPYGDTLRHPSAGGRVLFAGDAAGLADPISGEGLYYAVLSGCLAGESIAAGGDAAADYEKRIEPLRRTIREGVRLQKLFYLPAMQAMFRRAAPTHGGFIRTVINRFVNEGEGSYSEIVRRLLRLRR